jgi:hypothetical protein
VKRRNEAGGEIIEFDLTSEFDLTGSSQEDLLHYLLFEALDNKVGRVAIDPSNSLHRDIAKLPLKTRKRWLIAIKKDRKDLPELQALMRPIAEEFQVELSPKDPFVNPQYDLDDNLWPDLQLVYDGLYRFLPGIQHKQQIDIALSGPRTATSFVAAEDLARDRMESQGLPQRKGTSP